MVNNEHLNFPPKKNRDKSLEIVVGMASNISPENEEMAVDWEEVHLETLRMMSKEEKMMSQLTKLEQDCLSAIQSAGVYEEAKMSKMEIDNLKQESVLKLFRQSNEPRKSALKIAAKCYDFKTGKLHSNCNQILIMAQKLPNNQGETFDWDFQRSIFMVYSKQPNADIIKR